MCVCVCVYVCVCVKICYYEDWFLCRTSCRTISLYLTTDLTHAMSVISTNVSPATLIPHYDPDTHLLFLTGKVRPYPLQYYLLTRSPLLFFSAPIVREIILSLYLSMWKIRSHICLMLLHLHVDHLIRYIPCYNINTLPPLESHVLDFSVSVSDMMVGGCVFIFFRACVSYLKTCVM